MFCKSLNVHILTRNLKFFLRPGHLFTYLLLKFEKKKEEGYRLYRSHKYHSLTIDITFNFYHSIPFPRTPDQETLYFINLEKLFG